MNAGWAMLTMSSMPNAIEMPTPPPHRSRRAAGPATMALSSSSVRNTPSPAARLAGRCRALLLGVGYGELQIPGSCSSPGRARPACPACLNCSRSLPAMPLELHHQHARLRPLAVRRRTDVADEGRRTSVCACGRRASPGRGRRPPLIACSSTCIIGIGERRQVKAERIDALLRRRAPGTWRGTARCPGTCIVGSGTQKS